MVVRSPYPDVAIPDISLADHLLHHVLQHGNKVAMIDTRNGARMTFKEIFLQARQCASALHSEGLRPGDVGCICAINCVEYAIVTLGILACGATITTVNPKYKKGEFLQRLGVSEPRMVFANHEALEVLKQISAEVTSIEKIFAMEESNDEFETLQNPYEKVL